MLEDKLDDGLVDGLSDGVRDGLHDGLSDGLNDGLDNDSGVATAARVLTKSATPTATTPRPTSTMVMTNASSTRRRLHERLDLVLLSRCGEVSLSVSDSVEEASDSPYHGMMLAQQVLLGGSELPSSDQLTARCSVVFLPTG